MDEMTLYAYLAGKRYSIGAPEQKAVYTFDDGTVHKVYVMTQDNIHNFIKALKEAGLV